MNFCRNCFNKINYDIFSTLTKENKLILWIDVGHISFRNQITAILRPLTTYVQPTIVTFAIWFCSHVQWQCHYFCMSCSEVKIKILYNPEWVYIRRQFLTQQFENDTTFINEIWCDFIKGFYNQTFKHLNLFIKHS